MNILEEPASESCGGSGAVRTSQEARGNPTVSALLENDHREIDALFSLVEGLIAAGNCAAAAESFRIFQKRLDAHIAAEEFVLFPAFEKATARTGPTRVMRSEHGEFRRLMVAIRAALEGRSARDPLELVQELGRSLRIHNVKEERVLYPQMDVNLDGGQLAALVTRIALVLG